MKKESAVILHNIRSNHNVGSIFRTSDAAGVTEIILSGYTPTPLDRFGRDVKEISKTALGAQMSIPWKKVKSAKKEILRLKKENFVIIAIEQAKNSVDYKKVKTKNKTVFIVGNEVDGLPKDILDLCDVVAEIPMKGKKESLNVSVAFGIALFRMLKV